MMDQFCGFAQANVGKAPCSSVETLASSSGQRILVRKKRAEPETCNVKSVSLAIA
jgi:hypothetical protein